MSMNDPIADMLTRIRNASKEHKPFVLVPCSKIKQAIAEVFCQEGYLLSVDNIILDDKPFLRLGLKYHNNKTVFRLIKRISKPSLRRYSNKAIEKVDSGLGVAVISTSQGVMADREARRRGIGGEVLCVVS